MTTHLQTGAQRAKWRSSTAYTTPTPPRADFQPPDSPDQYKLDKKLDQEYNGSENITNLNDISFRVFQ